MRRGSPDDLFVPPKRREKPVPHGFVLDALARLDPTTRPMFGCLAVYVDEKIVLILREKRPAEPDDGVWIATTAAHHASLRAELPSMRSITVLGSGVTGWQVLPADAVDFEEAALHACALILAGDPRIGKVPAQRRVKPPRERVAKAKPHADRGPFRADQLRSGDPYELSNGHAIHCLPSGGRGAEPNRLGASVVGWDPAVTEAGVDAGYSPEPGTLRAPDVAVGNVPNGPGWIVGAPDLAIEYADVGQDEAKLDEKIKDLLAAGTRFLWVVRLTGPRRVDVHQPGKKPSTRLPGQLLEAPGVLKNPVRVEALYDRDEAERATLVNLLQRRGFEDLDAVLAQGRAEGEAHGRAVGEAHGRAEGEAHGRAEGEAHGRAEGRAASVLAVLEAREIRVTKAARERIERSTDVAELDRWVRRAAVVRRVAELFK